MNGNEKLERELESFLQEDDSRVAVLYRKLPRPEPDAKVDAAVLAMARRAATPPSHARNRRWLPALSAAAAIVLAASVAIRVGPQIWNSHTPPAASARDEQIISVQTQELPRPPAPPAPPASPASPPAEAQSASPVMAPPPMPAQSAPRASQIVRPPPMPPAKIVAPLAPPSPAQRAQGFDMEKSTPAASAAAAVPPPSPQSIPQEVGASRVGKNYTNDRKSRPAPPPPPAPAVAFPAAPAVSQSNDAARQNAATAAGKQERQQADSAHESAAAGAAAARAVATPAPAEYAPSAAAAKRNRTLDSDAHDRVIHNSRLYPESWIGAIRRLVQEGHNDEANANLDYFRKQYPDYHLPADLERFAKRTK